MGSLRRRQRLNYRARDGLRSAGWVSNLTTVCTRDGRDGRNGRYYESLGYLTQSGRKAIGLLPRGYGTEPWTIDIELEYEVVVSSRKGVGGGGRVLVMLGTTA